MNKEISNRLAAVETSIRTTSIRRNYCITIKNALVETTKIVSPGNFKKTIKEYNSPLEAVLATERFILQRRLNILPYCQFDNIIDLYPEAASAFDDLAPIKDLLHPYYGRDGLSIYQYELRHILIYRHSAACIYASDHNTYATGEHPDQYQFEALMQSDDAVQSQIDLLTLIYDYYSSITP